MDVVVILNGLKYQGKRGEKKLENSSNENEELVKFAFFFFIYILLRTRETLTWETLFSFFNWKH